MEDERIIELFWQRSEAAIAESQSKYSNYCYSIAFGILRCTEDAEECVSDTFIRAWNAIPPARPLVLRTFLGKITRNLALNVIEKMNTRKRGQSQLPLVLSELDECISDSAFNTERQVEDAVITDAVNSFLKGLSPLQQKVFVRRYWYTSSIEEIAKDYGITESKVKSMLFRLRKRLKRELEKEGVSL